MRRVEFTDALDPCCPLFSNDKPGDDEKEVRLKIKKPFDLQKKLIRPNLTSIDRRRRHQ
jgi:hypothetical protein